MKTIDEIRQARDTIENLVKAKKLKVFQEKELQKVNAFIASDAAALMAELPPDEDDAINLKGRTPSRLQLPENSPRWEALLTERVKYPCLVECECCQEIFRASSQNPRMGFERVFNPLCGKCEEIVSDTLESLTCLGVLTEEQFESLRVDRA